MLTLLRLLARRLENLKHPYLFMFLIGLASSALYTFVIYRYAWHPRLVIIDPDQHGLLGMSLYKYGTFSYYPDHEPTLRRMPGYPLFIALMLLLSKGWHPYSVQIGQCVIFGLPAW